MQKQWKLLKIEEGNELKTAQQLDALHIRYRLPINEVSINDIIFSKLRTNAEIMAFIDEEEETIIKKLPFVIRIE